MKAADIDPRSDEWDALSTLLGAYLHQDFVELHGSPVGAVRDFISEGSANDIVRAADQARALRTRIDNEEQAQVALDILGMEYAPWLEGWTCRDWLAELENQLRARDSQLD